MWSETIEFRGYREPFLPGFFAAIAARIPLQGHEHLLDLACGTGTVAFGFSPFVSSVTGVDMELPMLEGAKRHAEENRINIRLVHAKVEDYLQSSGPVEIVTIGKAHWFLDASKVVPRLEALLPANAHVVTCSATGKAPWRRAFFDALARWSPDFPWERMAITPADFFAGSRFREREPVMLEMQHAPSLDDIVRRAFGFPCTSKQQLGDRTEAFVSDLKQTLSPFVRDGKLPETLRSIGHVFSRT